MTENRIPATTPTSHPDEDVLIAFAAGQLDLAYRVLLEAHLGSCRRCADQIGWMNALGERLLAGLESEEPPAPRWDDLERRLDALVDDDLAETPLPPAARAELEPRLKERRWIQLPLSTARTVRLWIDREAQVELVLARVDAGRRFPAHRHLGAEQVQVLSGGYRDPMGHFEAGDFATYPAASSHAPRIDVDEPCWIVTRIERGVQLAGWRGWLMRHTSHKS